MTSAILIFLKEKIYPYALWQGTQTTNNGDLHSLWTESDVGPCLYYSDPTFIQQGWEKYVTTQDSLDFSIWINTTAHCVLTYNEGDIILLECLSAENFANKLKCMADAYNPPSVPLNSGNEEKADSNITISMNNGSLTPQIYVACLSAYDSGHLWGKWIDATQEADIIREEIQDMLSKSPIAGAEEWSIHAFDNFGSYCLSEYTGIEEVHDLAIFINEHGELGAELMGYYNSLEDATEAIENNYHGAYRRELDFATELFDDIYLDSFPPHLSSYIDYEAFARDIFINDYFSLDVDGDAHVFSYF